MTTQFVAVVSESFVKRYWPGQDALGRTLQLRDEGSDDRRRRRRHPRARARARQRAAGVPAVPAGRRRLVLGLHAEGTGHRRDARRSASSCRPCASIIQERGSAAADHRRAADDRHRRPPDRVARRAGPRARRLRAGRVPAGGDRHPRRALVRGVAAHAGDRRAHRPRRAAPRHPGDGDDAAACCSSPSAWSPACCSPTSPAARSRRSSSASRRPTSRRSRPSPALTVVMALAGTLLPTLRALRVDPIKAIRAE